MQDRHIYTRHQLCTMTQQANISPAGAEIAAAGRDRAEIPQAKYNLAK